MNAFDNIIKNIIENYEYPYDENGWKNFIFKYKMHVIKRKIITYSTAILVVLTAVILHLHFLLNLFDENNSNNNITKFYHDRTYNVEYTSTIIEELLLDDIQDKFTSLSSHKHTEMLYNNTPHHENLFVATIDSSDHLKNSNNITTYHDYLEYIYQDDFIYDVTIYYNNDTTVTSLYYNSTPIDTPSTTDTLITPPTSLFKPIYYIPNAFSPNGDGINDEFFVIGDLTNIKFQLLIYDRWGNLVFESMNPNYKWDGGTCKQDVYYWIFRYQDNNGDVYVSKGYVFLLK